MPVCLVESDERYSGANENVLLAQLRAGDETTFLTLVDRYAPAMKKIARAYVRDDATAEDIVQEAWLGVLRGLASFEGRSSLRSWIFTIVVNRAKTRGVREARSVPFSALASEEAERDDPSVAADRFAGPGEEWPRHWRDEPASWDERPEERLLSRELRERLDLAIDALPPAQRTVVLLRDIAGKPTSEVCNSLALSETNVRVLLHRARAKISPIPRFVYHRWELRLMPDLDCIDLVELTTEYFEGALSPEETARLEAHLTECDGCTEFVRQMRVTQEVLGRIDTMVVPAAGRERLLSTFRAWRSEEMERSSDKIR